MIVFPNCKINLGLQILNNREDGYHNLETVFYPVQLCDALEVVRAASQHPSSAISFQSTGLPIDIAAQNNLCIKAYELIKKDFLSLPPVQMRLHKTIPMGAGLGGGSSDAAFTLKLLNEKFKLRISQTQLIKYALQLGSDCPFFIINKPCYATGRGEILEPVDLDLSAYKFAIVNPGIHIKTSWAFNQLQLQKSNRLDLKNIIQQPISTWKDELKNDFEEPVFKQYPEIENIKQMLYKAGAVYASMTGSGSTVFGIFNKDQKPELNIPSSCFYKLINCRRV
jgi:4-diphosphocytidyl-2-C-methyl-D-erythritol kinase